MDLRARDATRARCNVLGQPPSWFMNRAPVGTARRSFQCQARKFPQWRACAIRRRFHCVPQTGSMESEASRRRSQGRLGPTGDRPGPAPLYGPCPSGLAFPSRVSIRRCNWAMVFCCWEMTANKASRGRRSGQGSCPCCRFTITANLLAFALSATFGQFASSSLNCSVVHGI